MRKIGVGDFTTTPRMRELVTQALDSNRLSYGPLCRELEQKFAELHGCNYAVLSNSGTSSLQVALQTLKELDSWPDGAEVIVPAVTFVATVNIVLHNRMTPVLIDVEPDYYGLDYRRLGSVVTDKTRAVIPVHLFGMPCDLKGLYDTWGYLAHTHRQPMGIIEDSCETMFAKHRGISVGDWGHIACFSTYIAHILTTGVGGIAITDDWDIATKMRSLINHGRNEGYISIDDDDNLTPDELNEIMRLRFQFESVGHSYRITELEAALALAQLETWQDNISKRQTNAAYLSAGLEHLNDRLQLPAIRPYTSHSFMMYPLVLRHGDKWELCNFLESHGIETREMLRLTDQPCYKGMWNPKDYPVAEWINRQGFYIGCHPGLERADLDYVLEVFEAYFWARDVGI